MKHTFRVIYIYHKLCRENCGLNRLGLLFLSIYMRAFSYCASMLTNSKLSISITARKITIGMRRSHDINIILLWQSYCLSFKCSLNEKAKIVQKLLSLGMSMNTSFIYLSNHGIICTLYIVSSSIISAF